MRDGPSRPSGTAARQRLYGFRQFGRDAQVLRLSNSPCLLCRCSAAVRDPRGRHRLFRQFRAGERRRPRARGCSARGRRRPRNSMPQTFKTEVCKHFSAPLDCAKLKLDVRQFHEFRQCRPHQPARCRRHSKDEFQLRSRRRRRCRGGQSLLRLDLTAKLPKRYRLSNMANGNRLLVATVAFRNEPFQATEHDAIGLRCAL